MTLPATSQAQIIEAHLRVSESIREFRHQLRTRRASGMFGCNAAHAFFLTYLLSFFSFLLLLNLMGSVTPFSIKISGSEGTPDMMAFKAKAPKSSIPAAGTRERYVTLPHLTSNFGDFAIRRSKPRRSPTSDFAITTVWHSSNDGENVPAIKFAIIGGSCRQQDGIRQRWRTGAVPSVAIAILPSSPSLGIWCSSNDDDLELIVSRTSVSLY